MAMDTTSGNGGYGRAANFHSLLNGLTAFSISMWIFSRVINTDKGMCIATTPAGGDNDFSFRYDTSGANGGGDGVIKFGIVTTGNGDERQLESTSFAQVQDTWQHVAICGVNDGTNLALYIDGEFDAPTAVENWAGTITGCDNWFVGRGGKDTGSATWDGLISDMKVFNRALGAEEVKTIFTLRGRDGIVDGLLGCWRLNDQPIGTIMGTGDFVDTSNNKNNLDGTNSPEIVAGETAFRRRRSA